jgi:hypothetical protein
MGCAECLQGWLQAGKKCYRDLTGIPPVQTGAALGGTTYFTIIVLIQISGVVAECFLMYRLRERFVVPLKDMLILATATLIQIARMLAIDIVVLKVRYRPIYAAARCSCAPEMQPDYRPHGHLSVLLSQSVGACNRRRPTAFRLARLLRA